MRSQALETAPMTNTPHVVDDPNDLVAGGGLTRGHLLAMRKVLSDMTRDALTPSGDKRVASPCVDEGDEQ